MGPYLKDVDVFVGQAEILESERTVVLKSIHIVSEVELSEEAEFFRTLAR